MNEPQWERLTKQGKERWNLTEWRDYGHGMRGRFRHIVGFIVKLKNKHRCRAWLVYYSEVQWENATYIARLDDMKAPEAKDAARLLLLAQRRDT